MEEDNCQKLIGSDDRVNLDKKTYLTIINSDPLTYNCKLAEDRTRSFFRDNS